MANINKISVAGTIYDIQDQQASKTVELTQAEYNGLSAKDPNTFYIITDAVGGDLSNYYTKEETDNVITAATSTKQDTLVSGTNIKTINNESLLGEGNIDIQGGSSVNVVQDIGTSTSDVMSQDAVTKRFNEYTVGADYDSGILRWWTWRTPRGSKAIYNFSINGKLPLSMQQSDTDVPSIFNFHLVETSAVTTSVSSTSTDSQVPSAKAVYDQLGGLKLVKLSQSEYDALQTKDANTLFIIVN